jgi:hypothetical protein
MTYDFRLRSYAFEEIRARAYLLSGASVPGRRTSLVWWLIWYLSNGRSRERAHIGQIDKTLQDHYIILY